MGVHSRTARTWRALLVVTLTLGALPEAWAQVPAKPPLDEAKRVIAVPPLGVPVEPHRGFYSDFGLGTYFTVGGSGVSDAEPLLSLGLGYDIADRLTLGLRLGLAASSGRCFTDSCGRALTDGADSFSLLLMDLFFAYLHPMTQQWFLGAKLVGGAAAVSPLPVPAGDGLPPRLGMAFGGGLLATTELHTYLNHFVIGLDAGAQLHVGGGTTIVGIEFAARFKYVF